MTEALERAARAAYEYLDRHPKIMTGEYRGRMVELPADHPDWFNVPPTLTLVDGEVDLVEVARAVLLAVREPDGAVSIAGYAELSDRPVHADFDCAWRAGIDAILGETK